MGISIYISYHWTDKLYGITDGMTLEALVNEGDFDKFLTRKNDEK